MPGSGSPRSNVRAAMNSQLSAVGTQWSAIGNNLSTVTRQQHLLHGSALPPGYSCSFDKCQWL